jgi:alkanesulfonate monooxygenase SsuD/methylene tetrahydromethanopterin reductase-like flavin-dependent oxidoreductase (luciferase family)
MKFGFFSLAQGAPPRSDATIIRDEMEQMVLAEELGFDAVWMAEHHYSRYGMAGSPQVFFSHLAARTSKIRLGTAVSVLPFNHPLRTAEDFAVVDVLSQGRLNFGVGRGYQPGEFMNLGLDINKSRDMFNEALEVILQAWTRDRVNHDGRYWTIKDAEVLPKPLQKPHPPLYVACTSGETNVWAGTRCYPTMRAPMVPDCDVRSSIDEYRRVARVAGQSERAITHALCDSAVMKHVLVTDDDRDAVQLAQPYVEWYYDYLGSRLMFGGTREKQPYDYYLNSGGCFFGSPSKVIDQITQWRETTGCEYLYLWSNMGGVPHEDVVKSMKLFSEKVMPHFL